MNTLVIHMRDKSTDFLKRIYRDIPHTLVDKSIEEEDLISLIKSHDRVVMLGHGSPSGLFGNYREHYGGGLVIHAGLAPYLAGKDNVYIWCHASSFVKEHGLSGFSSGMFVSEVSEARYCGLGDVLQEEVTVSNDDFAALVGDKIECSSDVIFDYCDANYRGGAVARYNHSKLFQENGR